MPIPAPIPPYIEFRVEPFRQIEERLPRRLDGRPLTPEEERRLRQFPPPPRNDRVSGPLPQDPIGPGHGRRPPSRRVVAESEEIVIPRPRSKQGPER